VATISGTASVTIYRSSDYTTEAGMTGYSWTVTPATGSITGSHGTRSITVTVNPLPPTVASNGQPDEITGIIPTSATGNAQITNTNGANATARGYIWYP